MYRIVINVIKEHLLICFIKTCGLHFTLTVVLVLLPQIASNYSQK